MDDSLKEEETRPSTSSLTERATIILSLSKVRAVEIEELLLVPGRDSQI